MRAVCASLLLLVLAGEVTAGENAFGDSSATTAVDIVDLSGDEISSLYPDAEATHTLAKPWYQKVEVAGFGAFWFVDSGQDGTRPEAGFVVKESSLFIEAEAWEDMALFFEVQTTVLQRDHNTDVRTGEVHVHFRNMLKRWGAGPLGVKVGRVDIPFGEEYLWQDAPDNPLVSNSAAYPWLWDEGIVVYGEFGRIGWIASVMDGTITRSQEDDAEKAVTAKVYGSPWEALYLSASLMQTGASARSAILLGGSLLQPVGANGASSAGESPSTRVDTRLYQADVQWNLGAETRLDLSFGQAFVDDAVDAFDRDLTWFMGQARRGLGAGFYAAGRYSEIGTYDGMQGYHFGGEFLAGGQAFGYDAKKLRRVSAGMGWNPNPQMGLKLEVGRDLFEVIDTSSFDPQDDDRTFYVLELYASF